MPVGRVSRALNLATCLLDPASSWVMKAVRVVTCDCGVVTPCLRKGVITPAWKMAIVQSLLKRLSLDPALLDNNVPVSNLSVLGNVVEEVVRPIPGHWEGLIGG